MLHIFKILLLEQPLSLYFTQMLHSACYHFLALLSQTSAFISVLPTWEDSPQALPVSSFLWIINDSIIHPSLPIITQDFSPVIKYCFIFSCLILETSPFSYLTFNSKKENVFFCLILGNGIEF